MKNLPHSSSVVESVITTVPELLAHMSVRMGKITEAIIMISAVATDYETLTQSWVQQAITTMSIIHEVEYHPEQATLSDIRMITTGMRQIAQYQQWCAAAGIISPMNHEILATELDRVREFFTNRIETYCIGQVEYPFRATAPITDRSEISIEQLFSETPSLRTYSEKSDHQKIDQSIKDKDIQEKPSTHQMSNREQKTLPNHEGQHNTQQSSIKKPQDLFVQSFSLSKKSPITSGEDKKDRRDAIMRTIRSKGRVTIKDIAENITGCSEKTIQRDLQELIHHGVLTREGEKRWAVYMLAMKNS